MALSPFPDHAAHLCSPPGSTPPSVYRGPHAGPPCAAGLPSGRRLTRGGASIDPFAQRSVDLFAGGVADRRNIPALEACAALFGATLCLEQRGIPSGYDLVLALETGPGARNLFTYRVPPASRIAVLVGNERHGLSPATRARATALVAIPMRRRGVQSLNVASAAAIALSQFGTAALRGRPPAAQGHRPALVFLHPADPAEFGSTLRTTWTLGWDRAGLVDRRQVWFTRDRAIYVQGRGAARRHKNPLRVYPCDPAPAHPLYHHGIVITAAGPAPSLWQTRLSLGPSTALFFPDETPGAIPATAVPYHQLARQVQHVSLALPAGLASYHYRLVTAIALAEIARRLGWGPP
ncbi:MAG TPA: TrmH family RNA methyltransferase [Chloroflexia bacterium]|nr:TrmH family RNA methyltransferase [Chloroflexia bacterium]